jgi:hypothetical protein
LVDEVQHRVVGRLHDGQVGDVAGEVDTQHPVPRRGVHRFVVVDLGERWFERLARRRNLADLAARLRRSIVGPEDAHPRALVGCPRGILDVLEVDGDGPSPTIAGADRPDAGRLGMRGVSTPEGRMSTILSSGHGSLRNAS